MMNILEIQKVLTRMAVLLVRGGASDWATAVDRMSSEFTSSPVETAPKIAGMLGGMGSLNDVVLYGDGRPLRQENDELDALRSRLYGLLHPQSVVQRP